MSLAVAACGTLGGGDTDVSKMKEFKMLKGANLIFWDARIEAAKCVGDNDLANQCAAERDKLAVSNTISDLQNANTAAEKMKIVFDAKTKLSSAEAKEHFKKSLAKLIAGVAAETKLLAVVQEKINELNAKIQTANPFDKASLVNQLTPFTDIASILQSDISNATATIDAYTVYATENGLSMDEIKAQAAKDEQALNQSEDI